MKKDKEYQQLLNSIFDLIQSGQDENLQLAATQASSLGIDIYDHPEVDEEACDAILEVRYNVYFDGDTRIEKMFFENDSTPLDVYYARVVTASVFLTAVSCTVHHAPYNEFRRILSGLVKMPKLNRLYVQRVNMRALPELVSEAKNLTGITLVQCGLQLIPECLRSLKKLTTLNLRDNELQEVPTCIKGLPNLEYLTLDKNHFSSLPKWLFGIKSLKALHVNDNYSQKLQLPVQGQLSPNLVYITLINSSVAVLPRWLLEGRVERIDLRHNQGIAYSRQDDWSSIPRDRGYYLVVNLTECNLPKAHPYLGLTTPNIMVLT